MNRTERLYRIDQLIAERGVVSRDALLDLLEVSLATLKRDLEYLRDRLNAPIVWDRDAGGYRFERTQTVGAQYELPGLWFSDREIHALLTMQHLLAELDPGGLLAPHVKPLMARLDALLGSAENPADEIRRRVRILGVGKRALRLEHFEHIGSALLGRQRLNIRYFARGSGEESVREVSPQRLVHYRENWYLDAWCHLRSGLRSFAVDSIRSVAAVALPAHDVAEAELDATLGPGYGIFSGAALQHAVLRFSPERARWVASERWHPAQKGSFDGDGFYRLEFPYADPRELIMDVLRHGRHCEVLAPESLRLAIGEELIAMNRAYSS